MRWEKIERVERVADLSARGVGRVELRQFDRFLESDRAIVQLDDADRRADG